MERKSEHLKRGGLTEVPCIVKGEPMEITARDEEETIVLTRKNGEETLALIFKNCFPERYVTITD